MAVKFTPPPVGTFSKRMAIYAVPVNVTADGGTDETPATLVTNAWVSIESLSSQETWLAKVQQDKTSHIIRMLYQPGINAKMYGTWNGRTFNFTNVVDVDERHVELKINAAEVTP